MSKHIGAFALVALFVAVGAFAEATPPGTASPLAEPDAATAEFASWYSSVFSTGSCSARLSAPASSEGGEDFLLGISALAADDGTSSAEAGTFCERAIDPSCIGCFIGCPSGCWCICGNWFAQCCCNVAAE